MPLSTVRPTPSPRPGSLSVRCPVCGGESAVPPAAGAAIASRMAALGPGQSPCLNLPDSAFLDPRLRMDCPHCGRPIQLNPFWVEVE